jgi:hypothetical protein
MNVPQYWPQAYGAQPSPMVPQMVPQAAAAAGAGGTYPQYNPYAAQQMQQQQQYAQQYAQQQQQQQQQQQYAQQQYAQQYAQQHAAAYQQYQPGFRSGGAGHDEPESYTAGQDWSDALMRSGGKHKRKLTPALNTRNHLLKQYWMHHKADMSYKEVMVKFTGVPTEELAMHVKKILHGRPRKTRHGGVYDEWD